MSWKLGNLAGDTVLRRIVTARQQAVGCQIMFIIIVMSWRDLCSYPSTLLVLVSPGKCKVRVYCVNCGNLVLDAVFLDWI